MNFKNFRKGFHHLLNMYTRKDRPLEPVGYTFYLSAFLKSDQVAFIPDEQRDTHRYHWHTEAKKLGLFTKTLKLWTPLSLCGIHKKPITGVKPGSDSHDQCYDSDFECDYECNTEDCCSNCCYRDEVVRSKNRTVIIFKQVQELTPDQTKEYLLKLGLIRKENGRYSL